MLRQKTKHDYFVPDKKDPQSLLSCMTYYLYKRQSPEINYTIREKLLLHFANLLFQSKKPIEDVAEVETLGLRQDCYQNGSVRLWVFQLHRKHKHLNIPEKAKHVYLKQPTVMATLARSSLQKGLDKYTMCHLFGDVFQVEVYLDNVHVQEAASLPLDYQMHSAQMHVKTVRKRLFSLRLPKEVELRRRSYSAPTSTRSSTSELLVTKYELFRHVKSDTSYKIGAFTPTRMHHAFVLKDYTEGMTLQIKPLWTERLPIFVFGKSLSGSVNLIPYLDEGKHTFTLEENHNVHQLIVVEAATPPATIEV